MHRSMQYAAAVIHSNYNFGMRRRRVGSPARRSPIWHCTRAAMAASINFAQVWHLSVLAVNLPPAPTARRQSPSAGEIARRVVLTPPVQGQNRTFCNFAHWCLRSTNLSSARRTSAKLVAAPYS